MCIISACPVDTTNTVARPITKFRAELVARWQRRIAAGHDEAPAFLDHVFSARRFVTGLFSSLEACRVGDGDGYRDVTAEILAGCLSEVVDVPLMQMEVPCQGGRIDIEMPLRLEALGQYPLWDRWATRYRASSILVEVKNEASRTDLRAVHQIEAYLHHAGRGGLGLLVSRSGMTANASKLLSGIARAGDNLIIPISHEDFTHLAKARKKGAVAVMEFVRRKQTLLLQSA
ncbi:MAG: hypothetical protein JWN40_1462 [Phycisphaerales bacterium]|nr:hypothetical protein [Phycisphaerales bacterium]